jgi:hypothetical protein
MNRGSVAAGRAGTWPSRVRASTARTRWAVSVGRGTPHTSSPAYRWMRRMPKLTGGCGVGGWWEGWWRVGGVCVRWEGGGGVVIACSSECVRVRVGGWGGVRERAPLCRQCIQIGLNTSVHASSSWGSEGGEGGSEGHAGKEAHCVQWGWTGWDGCGGLDTGRVCSHIFLTCTRLQLEICEPAPLYPCRAALGPCTCDTARADKGEYEHEHHNG